jgi:prenyltransferase beta subunit
MDTEMRWKEGLALDDLAEFAYLYLLVDQWEDGLWGRSISPGQKVNVTSRSEVLATQELGRGESLSVTFFAVDSLCAYTGDTEHPAILSALDALPKHRMPDGSYGSYAMSSKSAFGARQEVLKSCRHTASALLLYDALDAANPAEYLKSIEFLVGHQKDDGGWGVSADVHEADSDCLSTAFVLQVLSEFEASTASPLYSMSGRARVEATIALGLDWLRQARENGDGFWLYGPRGRERALFYTAIVLASFHKLQELDPALHSKAMLKLLPYQNEDGGWPLRPGGRTELNSTIWMLSALLASNSGGSEERICNCIRFLEQHVSEISYQRYLTDSDWAMLLKAAALRNCTITRERDESLRLSAKRIGCPPFVKKTLLRELSRLGEHKEMLVEPLIAMDASSRTTWRRIALYWARQPRWIRCLIGTIGTIVLGSVVGWAIVRLLDRLSGG